MNRQFGALRGLAAVLVVLNHSVHLLLTMPQTWGASPVEGWIRYPLLALQQLGILAVPIFLFISGCFAVYTAQGSGERLNWKPIRAGLRYIVWPYIIWSGVFYVLLYHGHNERYNLAQYLKHLAVGYPYNFVPLFLTYYLVSPLLVWVTKRIGWFVPAAVAVYQLVLLNLLNPDTLGFAFPEWMQALSPPVVADTLSAWAVFYPLGLYYSMNARRVLPWLMRIRWAAGLLAAALFGLSVLDESGIIRFSLVQTLCPLVFCLMIPTIRRDSIPAARDLEHVGKRAYFLYLANLIVIDLALLAVRALAPGIPGQQVAMLLPVVFLLALTLPMAVSDGLERLPVRAVFRYVFG